jgi:hypothetical protein
VVRPDAPEGIVTVVDGPVDVGVGVVGEDDELLQAAPAAATAMIRSFRNVIRLLYGSLSAAKRRRKLTADQFV